MEVTNKHKRRMMLEFKSFRYKSAIEKQILNKKVDAIIRQTLTG
jgi:hypothetical protein